ncbi:MAG: CHAT domain-containing protein [Bacteroidia bacterium]|nr:CHAT domain-containing protein [Bacteroidia bacterium]
MNNYRIVHFATHGFVNSQKPELSGILLAQTTELQNNIKAD